MTTFNFSIPRQTQHLWQTISSHWSHYNRPDKQRFLGSIQISQKATDQVLDVVGYNLSNLSTVTYNKLYERFDEPEHNWLKILTFALSEYAYYYSSVEEKFWYGFCQKLQLSCNQSLEKTLRRIVGDGFDLLGLVKAKGGYPYVSTLWLQSGIPQQNLNHFAHLVQEFSNEYGWWEIAHSSCEDISEELFDFCHEKHPQWTTLIHFLKSSCPQKENEEVEPISGQLLQGIAIIAVELERQGTLPEALKDDNEREKLLRNYYLPNNFFLRDWNSLIQVLTPKQRRFGNSRKIISRRQKPLSLVLDVTESLNMQLVLPEQSLWKKGWERLSGTFCQIPAAHWEGTIPNNPGLMIPEQVVNIKSGAELWEWQLLDHRKNCLNEWKLEGVASNLPCLIFDAGTGEHLNLDSANPSIRGAKEIIFFTPKGICLDFGNGIEIVDTCVPSSIRGWQGKQLTLTTKESSIVFIAFSDEEITTFPTISWKLSSQEQPSLRGLKLKGKKSVYLEIPTFWYPPIEGQISLNVYIENITHQKTIITTTEIIQPSDKWQAIPLDKWIIESGKYEARFWNQFHRWSYKFETQSNYQMASKPEIKNLLISSSSQGQVENLPIHNTSADTFWAEEIKMKGLLPLEIISLSLYDRQETVSSQSQADSLGNLHINLASFYNLLSPHSNWYALDFQRIGGETQRLIEMEVASLVISCTWDNQAVQISGLLPNELYSLSCWNLLLPENPPVEIKIYRFSSNEDMIAIPLKLQPGIYNIQILGSRKLRHNLGWWCNSNQNDLPDETLENEDLADYCYTILDNESVSDFVKSANKYDYDPYLLQTAIDSLKNLPCYLPEWLQINSLTEKLQAIVENLKVKLKSPPSTQKVTISKGADTVHVAAIQENWLLISLTNPKKRNFVFKQIEINIEKNHRQKGNLSIHLPKQPVYNDILVLKYKNINNINSYIPLEYIQQTQPLTSNEAQNILKA
ncbi:Chromosome segregation ATPase-like (plasmid) [Nostoc flagelliforme CCNUN1]|uniref:Chromosome segregation ATPase-like n=1 Tax=Nostoc flagelliforme CCNUN1 TaxID=2038116 RepID=A0A2K8T700_9NOSO|nr:chromosome partitioning protein ParA [Nostoc flagelliforme]AUB43451.1 Chromosome segregation ATPase-like [Nostoc flagelliforme CCNUN1]